jgi:hypothetical protein
MANYQTTFPDIFECNKTQHYMKCADRITLQRTKSTLNEERGIEQRKKRRERTPFSNNKPHDSREFQNCQYLCWPDVL